MSYSHRVKFQERVVTLNNDEEVWADTWIGPAGVGNVGRNNLLESLQNVARTAGQEFATAWTTANPALAAAGPLTGGGATAGNPIFPGQSVEGEIDEGETVVYTLTLEAPMNLTIDLVGLDDLDPVLEVLDSNGDQLERDDDGGDGFDSQVTRFFVPGVYYLSAGGFSDAAGRFRMTIGN